MTCFYCCDCKAIELSQIGMTMVSFNSLLDRLRHGHGGLSFPISNMSNEQYISKHKQSK